MLISCVESLTVGMALGALARLLILKLKLVLCKNQNTMSTVAEDERYPSFEDGPLKHHRCANGLLLACVTSYWFEGTPPKEAVVVIDTPKKLDADLIEWEQQSSMIHACWGPSSHLPHSNTKMWMWLP